VNNYNLISIVMAVVILGGGYVYYGRHRRDVERNLMEAQSAAREKERSPASKSRVPLPFVLLLVGVCLALFFGYPQFEAMWQARHPAVKEHLAELIQVAAKQLDCPADAVKITAEGAMQVGFESILERDKAEPFLRESLQDAEFELIGPPSTADERP
jgi:hypothetical protein